MKLLKSIYNWIVNVEKDKLLHYTVSLILALTIYTIWNCFDSKIDAICWTYAISFVITLSKEIYDEYVSGTADDKDWSADMLGIVTALIYCLIN